MENNKYYTKEETLNNTFYQFPKVLLGEDSKYNKMTHLSKILYMVLKDRNELSIKNNWFDEEGKIFFYADQEDLLKLLNIGSKTTLQNSLKELKKFGLLETVRQGQGFPNRNYLLKLEVAETQVDTLMYRNCTSRSTESVQQEVQKLYGSNTKLNKTENNNTIKKEKKKTEIDLLIEDYTSDEELKELLIDFVKMRKGIKASITTLGMKKLLGKLDKISISKEEKIEILNNSIMNSWKGIFELKKSQALPTAQKQYTKTETTFKKGCGERSNIDYDNLEKQFQEKNEDDLKSIDRASSILNRIGI